MLTFQQGMQLARQHQMNYRPPFVGETEHIFTAIDTIDAIDPCHTFSFVESVQECLEQKRAEYGPDWSLCACDASEMDTEHGLQERVLCLPLPTFDTPPPVDRWLDTLSLPMLLLLLVACWLFICGIIAVLVILAGASLFTALLVGAGTLGMLTVAGLAQIGYKILQRFQEENS